MIPIECNLFQLDVLERARPLFFWRVAPLLNKQVIARREPVNVATGAVLDFGTIADPTSDELDDAPAEFVITASIPVCALPA